MKKKNRAFYRYFIPVIYAVFVYILWELTGTLVAYVVGKVMDNWEETLYSSYISMLFNEVLTFVIMFVLFRKKADFVRKEKRNGSWLPVLGMFIFPLIQIGNDLMTLVHGKKVFSLLSGKGICFFLICGVASLSIGLLEEYVWRGILLNMFLAAWGKKKNGIYCAVVVSSLGFGLCHYRNLLVGQNFADTTKQVLYAICFGMFLAALFIQTNHLFIPVLVHGLCNFSNFFMNEILGWNYTVWKYDDILQGVFGGSVAAIVILIIAQLAAQLAASALNLIKIPDGICNIIAGIFYVGLTYVILKIYIEKVIRLPISDFGMPVFHIKRKWILIAILLPLLVKGSYLLFFQGAYVSSHMNGKQIFRTLSAGIMFTGIAAGFVEEMVFRGVILNLLRKKWNRKVAVIVPSVLFGMVHILGMDFSIGSCLQVLVAGTMAGIMFSMIAIESGSVWNSGIVHAIWNIVMIGGGLAIGQKADQFSVMTYVLDAKSFAVTGGEFGMEASVISLVGYIIVTGVAFFGNKELCDIIYKKE